MTATLKNVDDDVADHLSSLCASLTKNTNLFVGREVPYDALTSIPEEAVFCFEIASEAIDPVMYGGATAGQGHYTVGQCRIRGAKNAGSASAKALGVEMIESAHQVIPTGYVEFRFTMGQPERIEPDSDGRERFVLNWVAEYEES